MIRHGESETNKNGLWTGWLDAPLTQKGRADAALAREFVSRFEFDKIYSSDLSRAKSTAEIVLPGCKYELSSLIREIDVGSLAGKPLAAVRDSNNQPMNVDGYGRFGGESTEQFRSRIGEFMHLLESEACDNIAVFCHWGVIRNFLSMVLGVEIPKQKICGNNCLVAVFEYSNCNWKLHSWINVQ